MRMLALAAMIGVGLFTVAAEAREYRDPAGRIVFDAPANWPVTVEPAQGGVTYLIAGNDDNECRFLATENSGSSSTTPYNSWRTGRNDAQFDDATWIRLAGAVTRLFPSPATVTSRARDDQGFWPVQRAVLNSPGRSLTVYAGMQLRPGVDMMGLCVNYDGEPPLQVFDQVLRSMAHPNDAAFRAAAEEQIAARSAAEAAAAQPPPQQEEPRRRN